MAGKEKPHVITAEVKEGKTKKTKQVFILSPVTSNGGRPSYIITEDGLRLVEHFASMNAPKSEIAAAMNVSPKTFDNRYNKAVFAEAYYKGKEKYKLRIREAQIDIMSKGSAPMAIFLGRNALGQTDDSKIEIMTKGPDQMSIEELYAAISKKKGEKE